MLHGVRSGPDMAYSATLQALGPFQFNSPDERPKWRRLFEQYRVASGLAKEDNEYQVSALLYCLGEEADDVLTSTNILSDSRKVFADVLKRLTSSSKFEKTLSLRELASINAVRGKQKLQNSLSLPYTASRQIVNLAS